MALLYVTLQRAILLPSLLQSSLPPEWLVVSLRSPGIIIHSLGNVTVLLAEERWPSQLWEHSAHPFGYRENESGLSIAGGHFVREIVTYGGLRVLLNRDVNWAPRYRSSPFLSSDSRTPRRCRTARWLCNRDDLAPSSVRKQSQRQGINRCGEGSNLEKLQKFV